MTEKPISNSSDSLRPEGLRNQFPAPGPEARSRDPDSRSPLPSVVPRRRNPMASPSENAAPLFEIKTEGDPKTESGHGTVVARIKRNRHPLSSLIASSMMHVGLLLLLMLVVLVQPEPEIQISLIADVTSEPVVKNPNDVMTETVEIELPDELDAPIEMNSEDLADEKELELAESQQPVLNANSDTETPTLNETQATPIPAQILPNGGGLEGRTAEARSRLAAQRGGSEASEQAVERALQWIIQHQRADGSWRFFHHQEFCQCHDPGEQESTTAATGLALLSLLGAGYTTKHGPYQEQVGRGLEYLKSRIRYTSHGGILAEGKAGMYAHAIATIALAEAYTLTGDTSLVMPIDEARKYIVKAQHHRGGWRYNPGYPGDMTVTGWQLMALKSCELAGFITADETWVKAEQFVDSLGSPSSGRYGYQNPDETNPTTTSVGLLSKMYLGMPREHQMLVLGANFVSDSGPSKTDVYFNYYATQVLHHLQHEDWKQWNVEMRDYLIRTQDQSAGHQAGSWHFEDQHGRVGGRLYTTAMAVMILEVYYRFMPLYEDQAVEAKDDSVLIYR